MRLFLSSSLFGDHGNDLVEMVGTGSRFAVILNALDNFPEIKRDYVRQYVEPLLRQFGFHGEEFDLRSYFTHALPLSDDLRRFDVVWATGGNAFLLRRAMAASRFDVILPQLLRSSPIVYGGWSAGSVVAGEDLYGIDCIDDPLAMAPGYPAGESPSAGLGLINATIVPHFESEHPEAAAATASVRVIEASGRPAIALRDGEVIVQDGEGISILPRV